MGNLYQVTYFDPVKDFLREVPSKVRAKIDGTIQVMQIGDFQSPKIKTLRGPVKELIVKEYRILFFIREHIIYFVRVFRKKSAKTPKQEIEYAERVYKMLVNQ